MAFSILVAVVVATLLLGLGQLLRGSIREAALSGAEQTGRVFAELEVGPEEYKRGKLTDTARADLRAAVDDSSTLQAARVWGPDMRLVHRDEREAPGTPAVPTRALKAALRGEVMSDVSDVEPAGGKRIPGQLLRIYVPISSKGNELPRDVLELHLPYAPVQATIDRRTRVLALVLGIGAVLFYCALLPTVLRGSRVLADLYQTRQLPLQRRLRRAMRTGEMALAYQPKVDLRTRRVQGVEALLRWRLPSGRAVAPGEFIPLIEATAVMEELTFHVFEIAVRQAADWDGDGIELDIAVNISACTLRDEKLPARLAERTAAYGLRPERFTLEVTESGVSQSPDADLRTLTALRAAGFKLSIDDFGTGESSLSRIDLVEFDEVKVDRSFVRHLEDDRYPVLLANIIRLAQAIGATVVAEGVESGEAADRLAELGCDVMQGYHLARPLPPKELTRWLHDRPGERPAREARPSAVVG